MEPINVFNVGLQRTSALRLFEKQQLTLVQAAKLAVLAGAAGVVVDLYAGGTP